MIFNHANIVLEDRILSDCSLVTEGDTIAAITKEPYADGTNLSGRYLAPGFVDEHCHGSGEHWFFEAPAKAAEFHLRHGTTSLLCSLWRNAGTYSFTRSIGAIRDAMGADSNIRGIHMEGPYLDPEYGSEGGKPWPIDRDEYLGWLDTADGAIRLWTFDPTLDGARRFALDCQRAGVRLAVCYSRATPELLETYVDCGLSIASHMLCGSGEPKPMFRGTREPGSDQFTLVDDRMCAEVIADSLGGHVRAYYLKLIYKCKGADGIALVSDCCAGGDTCGSDINVINGELYGSRLTLSVAIRNMRRHVGASVTELIRMASTVPARNIGIYDRRGSIAVGKIADLVILDDALNVEGVMLGGRML